MAKFTVTKTYTGHLPDEHNQVDRLYLHRKVLKSWEHTDFETDLIFFIWWRFEVAMAKIQTDKFFCRHGVYEYKMIYFSDDL